MIHPAAQAAAEAPGAACSVSMLRRLQHAMMHPGIHHAQYGHMLISAIAKTHEQQQRGRGVLCLVIQLLASQHSEDPMHSLPLLPSVAHLLII
jgi:hypothetical protein